MPFFILAGDLGATKTILAAFAVNDYHNHNSLALRAIKEFPSRDYSSFEELAKKFLSANSLSPKAIKQATFGIAGPVLQGHSKLTNLDWELDERDLAEHIGVSKIKLLNDLEASASCIPFLKQDEKHTLHDPDLPEPEQKATAAVIAPGTGLGEAYLTWDGKQYRTHASEGGHTDFAPGSKEEEGLLEYLREKFGHVSYELVCSGKGIYNTWSYFHDSKASKYSNSLCAILAQVAEANDPTPVIVDAMMSEKTRCKPCLKTLDTFVSVLGAEIGNIALKFLARGGVYVAGGLSILVLPALTDGRFKQAYLNKGRMSKLVSQIPVHVVLTHNFALLGAAHYTLDSLVEEKENDGVTRKEQEELVRFQKL